jgi:hypothetical protein
MEFDIGTLFEPVIRDSRVEAEEGQQATEPSESDTVPRDTFNWREELSTKNILLIGLAGVLLLVGGFSIYYNQTKGRKHGHSHSGNTATGDAGSGAA